MLLRAALFFLLASGLSAQDFSKLPEWARTVAQDAAREKAPTDAEAWVLLDRTEIAYTGSGEIRLHHLRLVQVLQEKGTGAGGYAIQGLGGKATKVKKLKGWNLRPDGEMVRLDKDEILTFDADAGGQLSTDFVTAAHLDRVEKGSYVAFEAQEVIRHPLGPIGGEFVMEGYPVRRWELSLAKQEGWFTNLKAVDTRMETIHFAPWLGQVEITPNQSIRVWNVPALPKYEGAVPPARNVLPRVIVQFQDPTLRETPSGRSWDTLAQWYHATYLAKCAPTLPEGLQAPEGRAGLEALTTWMGRELRYRQVYLTSERGWVPEEAKEVHRRRLGDCKDLTACLIAGARKLGFEAAPVLALIEEGEIEGDEPVSFAFNHVITAVRLNASLGLPAEVQTPRGLFLLVDPTSRITPLGRLHSGHRGGRVLICTAEGGAWAAVPAAAVERPATRLELEGAVAASGKLTGILTVLEESNHLGLRSSLLQGGPDSLKSALQSLLDLPPTGTFKVEESGDPLDLGAPFRVRLKVDHPDWFRHEGSEWVLRPYGVPGHADLIQKPGEARRFPVWLENWTKWSFKARLSMPGVFTPVKAANSLETPLRAARSSASAESGQLLLSLDLDRRPARFGFENREEGVKTQKRDRNQWKLFLEEFGSFKPGAP